MKPFTRGDVLYIALIVLGGAGGLLVYALAVQFLGLSDDLARALLYGSGLAALAGVAFLVVWGLMGLAGRGGG